MNGFVSLLVLLSSLLASGGSMSNQAQLTTDTVRNKEIIKKLFGEIINNGKMDALDEIFSADYRGPTGEKGPEAFAKVINPLKKGFPDIHYEIEDLLGEGEIVVVHWFWSGTHEGTYREFEPSHKKVRSEGIAFFKFKGDKVVSSSMLTDRLGFLQEIDVLPKNISAPPKNLK